MENSGAAVSRVAPPQRRPRTALGRPTAECLEGILWVLRTGARWRDMPDGFPDGSTCWRRLRSWEQQGIWLQGMAKAIVHVGPAPAAGLGRSFSGRHLYHRQKGGSAVGKTRRGKGTKCMVVVDGHGIPVGAQLASAQLAECRLAESTLATVKVPRKGRGRPRWHLKPNHRRSGLRLRCPAQALQGAGNRTDCSLPKVHP